MSIEHISDTARWVAMYRAMESERPDALFHDPYARRLAGVKGDEIVNTIRQGRSMAWAMIVRTQVFDEIIMGELRTDGIDLVLNLAAEPGETAGFSAERHLHVLAQHAPDFRVDHIVVDAASVTPGRERDHLSRAASHLGADVSYADVSEDGTQRHDPAKLAVALETYLSPIRGSARAGIGDRREIISWQ